jgi:hypothetical protein
MMAVATAGVSRLRGVTLVTNMTRVAPSSRALRERHPHAARGFFLPDLPNRDGTVFASLKPDVRDCANADRVAHAPTTL